MNRWKVGYFLLILSGVLVLAGCASTRIVSSWSDDSYRRGTLTKPLVLVISEKELVRAKTEDEFTRELRAIGVDAVQAYKYFPSLQDASPEAIKAKLTEIGRDSILAIRLVDVKKETGHVPGTTQVAPFPGYPAPGYPAPAYYGSFNSYYAQSYTVVTTPGYSYEYKVFVIETNVYDAATDKLIWIAKTETDEPDSFDSALKEFVGIIVKDIRNKQIF